MVFGHLGLPHIEAPAVQVIVGLADRVIDLRVGHRVPGTLVPGKIPAVPGLLTRLAKIRVHGGPEGHIDLVDKGDPVFIDFTAAWCLSCQINDKITFSSEEVLQTINNLGITTIKADWTNRDESITKALASFGRNSVPLYVYFPGGNKEAVLLPEIITPGILLDYLNETN